MDILIGLFFLLTSLGNLMTCYDFHFSNLNVFPTDVQRHNFTLTLHYKTETETQINAILLIPFVCCKCSAFF